MNKYYNCLIIFILFPIALVFSQPDVPYPEMWETNGPVYAIAVEGNYTYIGGNFTSVGPNLRYGAKLTVLNDWPDLTFPKVNGPIYTTISDGTGGWYIGGQFTKVGAFTRNYIAHIFSDGTVDPTWNPNANHIVRSIAIDGSDIYVGGHFTSIGGVARNKIAKLNNSNGNAEDCITECFTTRDDPNVIIDCESAEIINTVY